MMNATSTSTDRKEQLQQEQYYWNQLVRCIKSRHFDGGQFLLRLCSIRSNDLVTKKITISSGNINATEDSNRINGSTSHASQRRRINIGYHQYHHQQQNNIHHQMTQHDLEQNHGNILHLVCKCRISFDKINLLLQHCSKAYVADDGHLVIQKLINEQDSLGWTSLHYAILYGCTQDVILCLIHKGGGTSNRGDTNGTILSNPPLAVTLQNNIGWTPLHLSCRHGTTIKVLKEMLTVDPIGALRTTATSTTTATTRVNNNDESCSNNAMAILWNYSIKRLKGTNQQLLQSIQKAAAATTTMEHNTKEHSNAAAAQNTKALQFLHTMKHNCPQLYLMWQQMIYLIMSTTATTATKKKTTTCCSHFDGDITCTCLLLHAAVPLVLKQQLPIEVIEMITVLYPYQLYQTNYIGRIPLHIALECAHDVQLSSSTLAKETSTVVDTTSSTSNPRTVTTSLTNHQYNYSTSTSTNLYRMIQILLKIAPSTAKIIDPITKRWPLHLAIDLGLSWTTNKDNNIPQQLLSRNSFAVMLWRDAISTSMSTRRQELMSTTAVDNNNDDNLLEEDVNDHDGGLKLFVQSAPESLYVKDLTTNLLPAMLSASAKHSTFETTFQLIKHCPSQIVKS